MILSDKQILEDFKNCKQRFCEWRDSSSWGREIREAFIVYEGESTYEQLWGYKEESALTKRQAAHQPCIAINKAAPVVDAVCGYQIQNRVEVKYSPRNLEPDTKADIVNNGIEYIDTDSNSDSENSLAFGDMLKTGVGAVDAWIDYAGNPLGEAVKERIPPYLVGWDVAARKRNFIDSDQSFRGALVNGATFLDEINDELEDAGKTKLSAIPDKGDDFLKFFDLPKNTDIGIVYNYYWRVKEPRYQVENAFLLFPQIAAEIANSDPEILEAFADKYNADISKDKYIWTEKKKELTDIYKFAGIEQVVDNVRQYKVIKHKTYKYYRARIVGDYVISKDENFSQTGHSLKFKTGKWGETRQCPYGIIKAAKDPQRLLNRAVSDLAWHIETNPYGGAYVEIGAVPNGDTGAFIDSYLKSREITFLEDGSIAGNKIMQKQSSQLPSAIPEMIRFADQSILLAMGANPHFMGMGDSGGNEYDIFGQRVKQGLMTLAPYFDSERQSRIEQARLNVDLLSMLAENSGGMIVRNLLGIKNEQGEIVDYMELLPDDISMEYDMVVLEQPKSQNEKQDMMRTLLDLGQMLAAAGRQDGAAMLAPTIIENLDMPSDKIDEIQKAVAPKPTPPDPANTALIQSQAALNTAQAKKLDADAKEKEISMLDKVKELGRSDLVTQEQKATIEKLLSESNLAQARADNITTGEGVNG